MTNLNNVSNKIQSMIDEISTTKAALIVSLNSATTDAQKLDINNRIAELEAIKVNLLNILTPLYTTFQTNVAVTNDTLSKQILALEIINAETVNSDRQLGLLTSEKRDKSRLVEINTYYGKQYNSHKQIMKTIVLICIPIIILTILGNKGLFPNTFAVLLISIIIIFGIFSLGYQIIDVSNRNNMNYDEYDWKFNKNLAPAPIPVNPAAASNDPWSANYGTCLGANCCTSADSYNTLLKKCCNANQIYDTSLKTCAARPIVAA